MTSRRVVGPIEGLAPVGGAAEVLAGVEGRVGHLHLNRPQAINALNGSMIDAIGAQLREWADSPDIRSVIVTGEGERGFCAGADVRQLREALLREDSDPMAFLAAEYAVNALIASFPKPYEALMHGIVMGGGLGLSAHASTRWVTTTSRLAMPETIIGFFPDVGLLWHLGRMFGEWGTHLALTGESIDGGTAIQLGLADQFAEDVFPTGDLQQAWILDCYEGDDPAEIVGRLEQHSDPAARATGATLRLRSPLSVAVTLEALRRAQAMATVTEVLAQDWLIAGQLLRWPDFAEGVRAQLVDRDRAPRWSHARIEDVTRSEVLAIFGE